MKEIKFRAWHKADRRMYDVYGFSQDKWLLRDKRFPMPPSAIVLMQYTGLVDKTGQEIYTGHIVKHQRINYTDCSMTEIESVDDPIIGEFYLAEGLYPGLRFANGTGTLFWPGSLDGEDFEILGYIHEHPNLLERSGEE